MYKQLLLLTFLLLTFRTEAADIECLSLVNGASVEVELKKANDFNNCFLLENLAPNTTVNITSFSGTEVQHKVVLYASNADGSTNALFEHVAGAEYGNGTSNQFAQGDIAIRVLPTTLLDSNKKLQMSHVLVDSAVHLIVNLEESKAAL